MQYKKYIVFILCIATSLTLLQAQSQKGKASYYSKRSTGSRTASGSRLHHDSLTCAHRTHPFGSMLKVTNIKNGKWVVVKVTDRGPYGRGRIIDLSWRAAKDLDLLAQGVGMVKVELLPVQKGIPFRSDESAHLPERDFEMAENGGSVAGEWQEEKKK